MDLKRIWRPGVQAPREIEENKAFRRQLRLMSARSKSRRRELLRKCATDPFFWVDAFAYTYDPRAIDTGTAIPMVLYPFQRPAFQMILEAIGYHDLVIAKSRCVGGTWLVDLAFYWCWLFIEGSSFLLISNKEKNVDSGTNPDSLFAKLDFVTKRLPEWMVPKHKRVKLAYYNYDMESSIDGAATTGDVGRGGRRTGTLWDEVADWPFSEAYQAEAATLTTAGSRLFLSTPQGPVGLFADKAKSVEHQVRLHWSEHPIQRRGLYTTEKGQLKVLDPEYEFPKGYEFVLDGADGKLRSPYYDQKCREAVSLAIIAQEFDIDFGGSVPTFFPLPLLEKHQEEFARPPTMIGDLDFDPLTGEPSEFIRNEQGSLRLWIQPDAHNRMPRDRAYILGADISAGTGASNTAFTIVDASTGEKVAEWQNSSREQASPERAAGLAVALCRWFAGDTDGAYMIWEANGPGRNFGDAVLEFGWTYYFRRTADGSMAIRPNSPPGWWSTRETKRSLLGNYRRALKDGRFINRSARALDEAGRYQYHPGGDIIHGKSADSLDPSGARDNHGDIVIADALACHMLRGQPKGREAPPTEIPEGSLAHRRELAKRRREVAGAW